jgi:TRAP-type transport system periplasmic protein
MIEEIKKGGGKMSDPRGGMLAAIAAAAILLTAAAEAQEVKHYRFAYDQPKTTGYGILGDIFAERAPC